MPDYIICHYGEIGLKGKNRAFFEEELVKNIKLALSRDAFEYVKRISGRIVMQVQLAKNCATANRLAKNCPIFRVLKNVFGIVYFAPAFKCEQDIEAINTKALQILKQKKFKSFKVKTKRSNKGFALTSQEVNEQVGEAVLKKFKGIEVDLEQPDITLYIEIVEDTAFLYTQKIQGLGGLPVGVSGKGVCLLSGGIDSPVAGFKMMSRGMKVIFVHFTSYPFTEQSAVAKVRNIIRVISKFQFQSKLYLVPITDFQKQVAVKCKEGLRVVLYRRFMLRIAEAIAKKERAQALITGDSLGQVASQTIENIRAISQATPLPILRPLIAMDKLAIIDKAKKIRTYEISIMPGDDTCQRFMPSHPETKSRLKEVKTEERRVNMEKFLDQALKRAGVEIIKGRE